MDSCPSEPNGRHDDRVDSLLDEYCRRRRVGEELTPEMFLAEHAELAEELRPLLEGLSFLDKIDGAWTETATGDFALPTVAGYVLHEEIGHGGMGVVFKALQVSTKRIVALKVVLAGAFASPAVRRRFKREVELAARLQHPSIVRVLESGRVERQRYYAMDYIDGVPLDRHLAAAQPDLRTILGIFMQICDAVEYAHSRGVIHRDLKPANVLVDDEGVPHILDFGLAKAIDGAEAEQTFVTRPAGPGQVMGTLPYISPEQAKGTLGEIDARADIYALGVMLYEAIAGSLPYDTTGQPPDVLRSILEETPVPPSTLCKRADSELDTIVLKALEKEEERRYQSAKDLGEDLRRYVEGEPLLARPPGSLYVLRKKLRRHRPAAAVCVVAIVAAIVVLAGLWAEARSRQRQLADARVRAGQLQHELEITEESFERVITLAGSLFARCPNLLEVRLLYARANWKTEKTRDIALQFLEDEVRRDASAWAPRLLLAEMLSGAGEAPRVESLRAETEAIAPNTAEAWYLRSFATLDRQKALHCAQEAVNREPAYVLAWRRLIWLRVDTGDLDGALEGADGLIELGEDRHYWSWFKGRIYARQGQFQRAIEHFTEARAYVDRAHAYRRIGEFEKAVADYTAQIRRTGGRVVWDYYQRATPLWILGRREEAAEDYRRVRKMLGRPLYADARLILILHELGQEREAQAVLEAALRDVDEPWLGQIFGCLAGEIAPEGLVTRARGRNNLEQLCEAYYYAGEVCLMLGRPDEARVFFQRCVQTGLDFDPDAAFGTPMNEYELARWRLGSLSRDVPAAPPEEN